MLQCSLLMLSLDVVADVLGVSSAAWAEQPGQLAGAAEARSALGQGALRASRVQSVANAAQKPSEMLISRTGLFYCATFPSKPGLPSSRQLLPAPSALCKDTILPCKMC